LKKEESNTRSLEDIDRVGKEKIEQLYEEAREQLAQRTDELRIAKSNLEEEENCRGKLEAKVKDLFNKNKFLTTKNSDLQTEIEHISSKSTLQIKRVRELEAINASI
jgi:hypothetical protein